LKQLLEIEIKHAGYISEKDAIKDINFSLKEGGTGWPDRP
jgi:hypothetical protein